ncbi:2-hydroxyhepta-2,4-diene-1,7-dioate isomerase [Shimwellia pseudoproteus]|nr:fumarylacetoacetate hydrolase family protein [Shimwellia pseudoproteus]MBJ3813566.1 2-hydroxyhepta-2,4-diene-1,7-dioate isomerase [Shimwellia pseudoproteus]
MKDTVFAIALNHQSQLDAWAQAFQDAPYKTPPRTPVWFIKPRNTVAASGDTIGYPAGEQVQSGGTVALVIGKIARKVRPQDAAGYIAGYALANELSLPETSFYRPAIQAKCRDGFCPLGPLVREADIHNLTIITEINGRQADAWNTADLARDAGQILSALSDFATLQPGDVILLGTPHQRVTLHPGDQVRILAAGFPALENTLQAEGESA